MVVDPRSAIPQDRLNIDELRCSREATQNVVLLEAAQESLGDLPQHDDLKRIVTEMLGQKDKGGPNKNWAREHLITILADIWSHSTGTAANNHKAQFRKFVKACCKPLSPRRKQIDEIELSDGAWNKVISKICN